MKYQIIRIFLTSFMLFLSTSTSHADSRYYLESDPIAFTLKGYSLHAGIQASRFRFQVGVFGATIPQLARDNPAFDVSMYGYGIKADYTGRRPDGWFIGIELENSTVNYTHQNQGSSQSRGAQLIGLRTGYKHEIGSRFFLTPWIAIKRNISDISPIEIGGDRYQESVWLVFPTIHLGMHF